MKRLMLAILCLIGCDEPPKEIAKTVKTHNNPQIVVIDGCEYIESDQGFGNTRIYSLTHKGNCKNSIHVYSQATQGASK